MKAKNDDDNSIKAFQCFGENVAHLIETIIYAYGPEAIIIGGSLSNAFGLFEAKMIEVLKLIPHQYALQTTKIMASGNSDIPVLGAAALVPYNLHNELSKMNYE